MKHRVMREVLDRAVDKNVVIFDAKSSGITVRLIDLVNDWLRRSLTGIIVSQQTTIPNDVLMKYRDVAIFRIDENQYSECHRYFKEVLWGTFPTTAYRSLGVGISSDFEFVLFSF